MKPSEVANLSRSRLRLHITGADRVDFLQGQCTNDVCKLKVGESCYAAFLNAKGKMRGEGYIICLDDAFLLEVNHGLKESLEKFIITEDVEIEDVSASLGEWLVIGKTDTTLPVGGVAFQHPLGVGVISAQTMNATISAGELEILRIESAVPKWDADMDENTIPNEAGLESRAISYDKGCYIGQETIARIKTYGHVNRRLIQCEISGTEVPSPGDKFLVEQREVGQVTSAIFSTRLGKALTLGYVRREFAMAGAKLECNHNLAEVLQVCGE